MIGTSFSRRSAGEESTAIETVFALFRPLVGRHWTKSDGRRAGQSQLAMIYGLSSVITGSPPNGTY
ncbi:hypothetical protein [Nonomuraea basaltis]|uniref:hypothetical protein n=1 Tax=Nonomuraea basaltis TaxID=2495887 RepID=UPI00148617AF|nr:hypothetical protein [Nonomuraea basaltis]